MGFAGCPPDIISQLNQVKITPRSDLALMDADLSLNTGKFLRHHWITSSLCCPPLGYLLTFYLADVCIQFQVWHLPPYPSRLPFLLASNLPPPCDLLRTFHELLLFLSSTLPDSLSVFIPSVLHRENRAGCSLACSSWNLCLISTLFQPRKHLATPSSTSVSCRPSSDTVHENLFPLWCPSPWNAVFP